MSEEPKGVWNLEYRNLHAAAKMDWVGCLFIAYIIQAI